MSHAGPAGPWASTARPADAASETALRQCLQEAPDGILVLDRDDRILLRNRRADELLGLAPERTDAPALPELLTPDEYLQWHEALQAQPPVPLLLAAEARPGRHGDLWLAVGPGGFPRMAVLRPATEHAQEQERIRLLSQALDCSDNAIFLCDSQARIRYVNEGFVRMLGYAPDEALGKLPGELIRGPHTDAATLDRLGEQHRAGRAHRDHLLGYRKDGSPLWLSVVATPLADASRSLVNVFTDITESKTHEVLNGKVLDALVREEPLATSMALVCQEVERVAPDLRVVVTRREADGQLSVLAAPSALMPADGTAVWDHPACMQALRRGRAVEVEDIASAPMFDSHRATLLGLGLRGCWSNPIRSTAGQVLGTLAFHCHRPGPPLSWHRRLAELCLHLCALALEREQARSRMHRLAFYDVLTGLPNRVMFNALSEQPLMQAEQQGAPMALLFVTLDRFKRINESQGHAAGDGLLRDLARRLHDIAGPESVVARQVADEFTLLVPHCAQHQAVTLCEELLAMVAAPNVVGSMTLHASASIGVAMYPEDGRAMDTLLRHADLAMRRAKDEGGGRFRFFSADMNRLAQERLLLEATLRDSLRHGGLRLHYQPQVQGDGSSLYGVEALLRWRHPHLGEIPPARFVPLAEECGLMTELSRWVLEEACRQHADWRRRGLEVPRIAVNLSASTFELPSLVDEVRQLLERHQLAPGALVLEITESVMLSEQPQVPANLHALHALGVRLSLDDFGTGYSSLSHLHRLPISEMKLDRSFISEIGHDPTASALILSVLRIGESLGKHVVAEGVETEAQRRFLIDNGSPALQGYLFSHALSADDFEQWLHDQVPLQPPLL
ncbi:MAG: EAL domain-containing protein [Stenotrophomonas nitritireducens]|uniref:sensor domain-containing protein n=1 Tax=Stenotrophomonas nitritireducens TaxID=83617 RepID=UPI001AC88321|nr:EAL domain-containing protein [Stenotrophomonas nitritireducens]MBN8768874.1 EAL domain-containing protein [Stenotrophomonas sp.]MBN8792912.1 EAL domain-containing protein [Stenotrophomonas nitritireducens]